MATVQDILLCGAGTMGAGIAQLTASAGIHTWWYDPDGAALERGHEAVGRRLARALSPAEQAQVMARLHLLQRPEDGRADLVIEAIIEEAGAKQALLSSLQGIFPAAALATNTSSLSVTRLAAALPRPEQLGGLHFFNPAPRMELVEVVRAARTSPAVLDSLLALARRLGKTPVLAADSPGFIVNKVARPYYLEAFRVVEDGIADAKSVDALLQGAGFPMGPFALSDLIGQDINLAVTRSLFEAYHGEARYRPSRLQVQLVDAGHLGRKTGRGFFGYAQAP